ncbi:hypothetical protein Tco_0584505 [Tanacetum coccineum]
MNIIKNLLLSSMEVIVIMISSAISRNVMISDYSGKLQLIDAIGSIDIVIHDLLFVWSLKDIYEYPGNKVVANNSSIYAEAIVLPWNLVVRKRDIDSVESSNGGDSFNEKWCDVVVNKDPSCKGAAWKLLLEFKSNGFSKYEGLRIGGYYLIKRHDKDLVCTANDGKVLVNSKSHLWSVSFSVDEATAGLTTTQSFISSYLSKEFQRTQKYYNLFPIKRHSNA